MRQDSFHEIGTGVTIPILQMRKKKYRVLPKVTQHRV